MKSYKLLTSIVFVLLLASATTSAYTPRDSGFVESLVFAHYQVKDNVPLGTPVDITVLVKNLTNETISNITLTQGFNKTGMQFLQVGDQQFNGGTLNLTDFSVPDVLNNQQLKFSYFNITDKNFTANLQIDLATNQQFAFDFTLNFTTAGTFTIFAPQVKYYDHWPDLHQGQKYQSTSFEVKSKPQDPNRKYMPTFETTSPDYWLIFGTFGLMVLIVLLSRLAYFKFPPFRL